MLDALEQACLSVDDPAELAVFKLARKLHSDDLRLVYIDLVRVYWRPWLLQGQSLGVVPLAYCLARYVEEVCTFDLVDPTVPLVPEPDTPQ